MLECEINPPDIGGMYLEALNRCFPHWGGERQYDWCFRRAVGGPAADLMLVRHEGAVVAGSAVTYRVIELPNGRRTLIGIMTGSWTLPEARGHGCFTRIIHESVALTTARSGAALFAFVTEDNASFRRLRDAGAGLVRTAYVFSPDAPIECPSVVPARPRSLSDGSLSELADRREAASVGRTRVVYTDDEWRSQFLERNNPTEVLEFDGIGSVAVEVTDTFVRLQATSLLPQVRRSDVIAPLLAHAQGQNRKLFAFSMDPALTNDCRSLGLATAPGFITLLAADKEALRTAVESEEPWAAGDSSLLADPENAWFLGPIQFESGDRM